TDQINAKFGTSLTYKNGIMLGDSAQDIIAGEAFGCKTVACRGGMGNREKLLEQNADFCFSVASEIEKFIDVLSKENLSQEETASIQNYAMLKEVPIVMDEGSDFICNYIKEHNCKSIFEIGTAIGFSTVKFAKLADDIKVTTIEIDKERFEAAQKNIEESGCKDRITSLFGDALEAQIDTKFDLIFIDAAKAQYIKFFEKYKSNLTENGVFISDNLSFHGMVEDLSLTHNYSTIKLVKKIRKYIDFLKNNEEFQTEFFKLGDGIAVSKRK
ncbi:MAG: class I SAM-dependent methyltransferase, partial [Treponema sp.]|nr:class I SAM-dependent methyltransferase [Candidatus Treponema equifaecale]